MDERTAAAAKLMPRSSAPGPSFLHELLDLSAARNPRGVAVDLPPSTLRPERRTTTYAELVARSEMIAHQLVPFVHAECIVAILLPRESSDLYAAQVGAMRAGAGYTCIDPGFPDERMRFILGDSAAVALITDRAGAERARAGAGGIAAARIIDVETPAGPSGAASGDDAPPRAHWLVPSSLAYVIYTSGTTGQPKGVMIEHQSIVNLVDSDRELFRLGPGDRVAQGSSAAYDSSVEETWLALAVGATVVVMDDDTARLGPDLVGWLERERITVFCPPPTLLRSTGCEDPEVALPDLRLLYVGGEALPRDVADRWSKGRWLENGYGPTECTVTVVRGRIREGEPIVIGHPVRGNTAWILDEALQPVGDADAGELCIAGPSVARGYLNRSELDQLRFPTLPGIGRVYRTGDLVRRGAGGALEYLGRIDSQVKLRGYRIELEAVDACLARCTGVRQAATRVQGDGLDQILVAFVVADRPDAPPAAQDLKAALRVELPEYMVPSRIGYLPELPRTTGGKLDRRALPLVDGQPREARIDHTAPRDGLERAISRAVGHALKIEAPISIDDDFFHELGGNSLGAAMLISELRRDVVTAGLTVRDVYDGRTVAGLAQRARQAGPETGEDVLDESRPRPRGRPFQMAALQALWLMGEVIAGSVVLYLAMFDVLPWAFGRLGLARFLIAAPFLVGVAVVVYAFVAVQLAAFSKRVLIGKYEAVQAPAWGSFYLRNWIVQQMVRLIPWGVLQGTVFQNAALRALGAKIGRRVHIHRGVDLTQGGWDLLQIGDDATVSQDATLSLVDLEDGHVVVGPVTLGAGSTLEVRAAVAADCEVGAGATLTASSSLSRGRRIPAGERWDGVPAEPAGRTEPLPALPAGTWSMGAGAHGVAMITARFIARLATLHLPIVLIVAAAQLVYGFDVAAVLRWAASPALDDGVLGVLMVLAPVELLLSLFARAAFCRVLGRVPAGIIGRWTLGYIRLHLKTEILDGAGDWLSGTIFWPSWLRAAGMRVGEKCEVSTIIDVVPELVEIGGESFLADGIYLGGARVDRGIVSAARTALGPNTFVGNHAVIPSGVVLPEGILIGVSTVADAARMRPGTSWFGHPAFELPRREIVTVDRRLTHAPSPIRYATRFFWEALRVVLPVLPAVATVYWLKGINWAASTVGELGLMLIATPIATLCVAAASCGGLVGLKWFLLGRVKPGQHPLWSCWCSRWDFLYVAWARYARGFLARLEGTPFLVWFLRAVGCRIGKRTLLGGGFSQVVDPDMLTIEDDATVTALIQAHSFEDRVLKIDHVVIRKSATVAAGAVLFYGAEIGEGAHVATHSVVMKHERLLRGHSYSGCPTRPMSRLEIAAERGPDVRHAAPAAALPLAAGHRWPAIDVARGLALLAMIFVHLVPSLVRGTLWEQSIGGLAALLEGKSAALFCVVFGFGLVLQVKRAGPVARIGPYFVRRAAALAALGWVVGAVLWPTEVIRPLALMTLCCAPLARRGPRVIAAVLTFVVVLAPVLAHVFASYVDLDCRDDGTHVGFLTFDWAAVRYFVFDGHYPLVPWLAFPLFGMLLASIDWARCRSAGSWFLTLLVLTVATQCYAGWVEGHDDLLGVLAPHLAVEWTPTTIPFMLLGGSFAGMVITGLLWWQVSGPKVPARPGTLRALGRSTLTHYVLHIGVAYGILRWLHGAEDWSATAGFLAFMAYLVVMAPLTRWWFRRFAQGPAEAVLSWLSGSLGRNGGVEPPHA